MHVIEKKYILRRNTKKLGGLIVYSSNNIIFNKFLLNLRRDINIYSNNNRLKDELDVIFRITHASLRNPAKKVILKILKII